MARSVVFGNGEHDGEFDDGGAEVRHAPTRSTLVCGHTPASPPPEPHRPHLERSRAPTPAHRSPPPFGPSSPSQPLLERIADGVLAADRRSAAAELRDLCQESRAAQFAVGAIGLPTLVGSLREERDDPEMVQGVLEALVVAITAGADARDDGGGDDDDGGGGEASSPRDDGGGGGEEDGGAPGGAGAGSASAASFSGSGGVGESVADAFARAPGNLTVALSFLDEEDFYVRYHAVQLLTAVSAHRPHVVREAVMSSPTGVGRLMDAMLEREVIRNETLLLLISLTRGSEDLRKIVAFEGAFERCFNIIREEGAADGGIIVQDCLELCTNLLRGSPSNQSFVREADGLVAKLPEFLRADAAPAPPTASYKQPMPAQKAANLLCAVELVTMLVSDGETPGADAERRRRRGAASDDAVALETASRDAAAKAACRVANQAALFRAGAMDALLELCLGANAAASAPVRAHATRCLGEFVAGARENQDALFAAETTRAPEARADGGALVTTTPSDELAAEPALLAALRVALRGPDAGERAAAEALFARCLRGNPDLQLVLVSTVVAPAGIAGDLGDVSLGGLLAQALINGGEAADDLEVSCRAAAVLRHALEGNAAAKAKMLTVPLELPTDDRAPPETLMPRIVRYLAALGRGGDGGEGRDRTKTSLSVAPDRAAATAKLQATLLCLLVTWTRGCPVAARAFLAPAANLPLLADLARSAESPHVAGLASVLLGCCLVGEDDDADGGGLDARAVLDVVTTRVGLDRFFENWETMRGSRAFLDAARPPTLAKPLTRSAARALAKGGAVDASGRGAAENDSDSGVYDRALATFATAFEAEVKARVISLYARPKSVESEADAAQREAGPGETAAQHAARLKSLLRSRDAELAEQRARSAALAEQLVAARQAALRERDRAVAAAAAERDGDAGSGGTAREEAPGLASAGGKAAASAIEADASPGVESAALEEARARARAAAEEELKATRAELEEARAAASAAEANLRSLSEAYNGLESELLRREEEARGVRGELEEALEAREAGKKPDAAAASASALASAREEGRREAISEMARRLEETETAAAAEVAAAEEEARGLRARLEAAEAAAAAAAEAEEAEEAEAEDPESELNDLLVCLGQEEAKRDALYARLVDKHGEREEDLDALLEEACAEEEEEGEEDNLT